MTKKNRGVTLIELLIIVSIIAILAVCVGGGCVGCNDTYSVGKRTGTVVKFSQKGNLYKSWEGQMHLGAGNAAALGANVWDFSVTDEAMVKRIQAAMDSGQPVTLLYHQWWISPVTIETGYVVVDVQPAAGDAAKP